MARADEDRERRDGAEQVHGLDTSWELGAETEDADRDGVPHLGLHGPHFSQSTRRRVLCHAFSVTQRSCSSVIVVV